MLHYFHDALILRTILHLNLACKIILLSIPWLSPIHNVEIHVVGALATTVRASFHILKFGNMQQPL
jgi:hypothetical protein